MKLELHVYFHVVDDRPQDSLAPVLDGIREILQHQRGMEARIVKELEDLEQADTEEAAAITNLTGLVTQGVTKIDDLLTQIGDQAGDRAAVLDLTAKARAHVASLNDNASRLNAALNPPPPGDGGTPVTGGQPVDAPPSS